MSVYSKPSQEATMEAPDSFFHTATASLGTLDDITFSLQDTEEAMRELTPNSAAGPDNIPAILLKKCCKTLAPPLYTIFRQSLDTGEIPEKLKNSIISLIYKGGSRGVPKSYRPVVLTFHIMKTMERVLRKKIIHSLENNNKLNKGQHGLRKDRSCV